MLYLNRNLSALSLDSLVILSLGKFSWDTGKLLDYSLPYIAQTSDQHASLGSGILWKEGSVLEVLSGLTVLDGQLR